MIKISGAVQNLQDLNQHVDGDPLNIVEKMSNSHEVFEYQDLSQFKFEVFLRENIIKAAIDLNKSKADFATFKQSYSNPIYWYTTNKGAFKLKSGVKPSEAIRDIFVNGFKYAFECATAMVIVLYKAVLDSIGEEQFNRLFANLLLYDWEYDQDLGITSSENRDKIFGDILYFKNPEVHPETPYWQGENAIYMPNDLYYGHGIGITTAEEIIRVLNLYRKPNAQQSAYLTDNINRPDYKYLYQFSKVQGREGLGFIFIRAGSNTLILE